jgi:hypothetical protein
MIQDHQDTEETSLQKESRRISFLSALVENPWLLFHLLTVKYQFQLFNN